MILLINRTQIINWIAGLRPFRGYKGYTWELLSKSKSVSQFNNEYWIYRFMFYDKDAEPYATKQMATLVNSNISVNDIAKAIIDHHGGFFIEEQ